MRTNGKICALLVRFRDEENFIHFERVHFHTNNSERTYEVSSVGFFIGVVTSIVYDFLPPSEILQ
jgi:hypothetical protein